MLALQDYRCVIALFEARHFGRAARRLGVTQPALTARLRRIEAAVEARLFDRGRGGVEPTAAGLAFVEGGQQVLDAAEAALDAARGAALGYGQTLRVGMTQIAAYQMVPRCLADFRAGNPLVRIRVVEGTTAGLESALEQRRLDAAFIHPPLHLSDLSSRTLLSRAMARYDAGPAGLAEALVHYPRAEAPVLMGKLAEATSDDTARRAEADTILGAIVLSQAGYGAFVAPEGYPHPAVTDGGRRSRLKSPVALETCLAWRSLDRRPVVRALIAAAAQAC